MVKKKHRQKIVNGIRGQDNSYLGGKEGVRKLSWVLIPDPNII